MPAHQISDNLWGFKRRLKKQMYPRQGLRKEEEKFQKSHRLRELRA